MGSLNNDLLSLISDAKSFLADLSDPIYAAPLDADFFRKRHTKIKAEPKAPLPIPAPLPKPEIVVEKPTPLVEAPKPAPEPFEMPAALPSTGLKSVIKRIAPDLAIFDEIPSDEIAKKISSRWKTKNQSAPITLLCYQEIPEQKALLEQIARALDVCYGPARLVSAEPIEKEKQWEALLSVADLKLIVCCDYTLWQLKGLMHFYREVSQVRKLKEKPLFLLPDLALYLKDPMLKRSLWKGLCQTIHSLPSS